MTEYEYLDAISTYRTEVALHAMNFIGILFAYLIAGYFAAHVLSRFQAVAVTAFYLILSPMPAIAAYEACRDFAFLVAEYRAIYSPDGPVPFFSDYWSNAWLVVCPGTMILSVVFMVQARSVRRHAEFPTNESAI
jgi:hypothetical protein